MLHVPEIPEIPEIPDAWSYVIAASGCCCCCMDATSMDATSIDAACNQHGCNQQQICRTCSDYGACRAKNECRREKGHAAEGCCFAVPEQQFSGMLHACIHRDAACSGNSGNSGTGCIHAAWMVGCNHPTNNSKLLAFTGTATASRNMQSKEKKKKKKK